MFPFFTTKSRHHPLILAYHALNVHAPGTTHASNDHVALAEDLACLRRMRYRVVSLPWLVQLWLAGEWRQIESQRWVALTFDDGTDLDVHDFNHPVLPGQPVPSFRRILQQHRPLRVGPFSWKHYPMAVSFVIASPAARQAMDQACMLGQQDMNDDWWAQAAQEGWIGIANHSWDHNHECVSPVAQREQRKGNFLVIDNLDDARAQVVQAQHYIAQRSAGRSLPYFAYPYGDVSDYLRREFFPLHQAEHGLQACFSTVAEPLTRHSERWALPRYVCGHHWKSSEELAQLLRQAAA